MTDCTLTREIVVSRPEVYMNHLPPLTRGARIIQSLSRPDFSPQRHEGTKARRGKSTRISSCLGAFVVKVFRAAARAESQSIPSQLSILSRCSCPVPCCPAVDQQRIRNSPVHTGPRGIQSRPNLARPNLCCPNLSCPLRVPS